MKILESGMEGLDEESLYVEFSALRIMPSV